MPIIYDELMQAKESGLTASYGDRETMLYALGIGFMRDPMNKDELRFVYENDLKTVPAMATVIGWGKGSIMARAGINYLMVGAWRAASDDAQAAALCRRRRLRRSASSASTTRARARAR